jgi:hypothetical protein
LCAQNSDEEVSEAARSAIFGRLAVVDDGAALGVLFAFFRRSMALSQTARLRALRVLSIYVDNALTQLQLEGVCVGPPSPGVIKLTVVGADGEFELFADRSDRPERIARRVARMYDISPALVSLTYLGLPLSAHRLDNGSRLSLEFLAGAPPVRRAAFPAAELSSVLFVAMEDAIDADEINLCQRILAHFPSPRVLVDALRDTDTFVASLRECPTAVLLYRLKVLKREATAELTERFVSCGGAAFLVEHLISRDGVFAGVATMVKLMQWADRDLTASAAALVPRLLDLLPIAGKHRRLVIDVFAKMMSFDAAAVTEICKEREPQFEKATAGLGGDLSTRWASTVLSRFTDRHWLISRCLEYIRFGSTDFQAILQALTSVIRDDSLFAVILDNCFAAFELSGHDGRRLLLQIVSEILSVRAPHLPSQYSHRAAEFCAIALHEEDPAVRREILALSGLLGGESLISYLKQELDFTLDRWNYTPGSLCVSSTGFRGLRNLGATCYMNAVFQQLFHIFPFRYLVMASELAADFQLAVRRLFTELLLSRKKFCDPQPFCLVWKGWDRQLVDVREQQDACEFLRLLLDQFPESVHGLFKGVVQNVITGVSEKHNSVSEEPFYTIALDIKGLSGVDSSLVTFSKVANLNDDNQYSIGDRKIDATRVSKILNAPEVLVLHLKRFEYDPHTKTRCKVFHRFTVPRIIDIQPITVQGTKLP